MSLIPTTICFDHLATCPSHQIEGFKVNKQKHFCKSYSHILSLSLLILLTAGDISPNPGPSSIPTFYQSRSAHRATNTRHPHNLIPIICQKSSTLPFSCALWNARSVCNKLTYIHDLFISNSLNLLALTETWLSPSDTASTAALSYGGLHFSHTPRPGNKQGGGVGILLSSRCSFNCIPPVPSLQFSSFEVHTIRLFSPISLRVAVIYRPPGPASQFLDHFSAWLPHFLSSNIPSLILGDFNIATDTPTSPSATKLLALTSSLGLSQLEGGCLDCGNLPKFSSSWAQQCKISLFTNLCVRNLRALTPLVTPTLSMISAFRSQFHCHHPNIGVRAPAHASLRVPIPRDP
ncbi:uncharacterized protein O3C94_014394 [Discoglossus pictus]